MISHLHRFLIVSSVIAFSGFVHADEPTKALRDMIQDRCLDCHGDADGEAGINLSTLHTRDDFLARPELLQRLLSVVSDRRMPPQPETPLSNPDHRVATTVLRDMMHQAAAGLPYQIVPIRRMNRFQYNNAVVDLLELDRDIFQLNERLMRRRENYFRPDTRKMPDRVRVSSRPLSKDIDNERPEGFRGVAPFPQDQRAEHGFDNRADHLSLSPLLMESFLQLSQSIAESPDLNEKECRSWPWLFAAPDREDSIDEALHQRVGKLLRRAFRRPVDQPTVDPFVDLAKARIARGETFDQAMRSVVAAVLAMPEFLYLYETGIPDSHGDRPSVHQSLDDYDLATRLAQFLWSSIPDDELLDTAESGRLNDDSVLSQQIDRMLDDPRSGRFCENFSGQWLQLDRLITAIPDRQKYPYFYYNGYRTSMHMMSEPLLLFETVFIEDRSIIDLIDPGFTYQSEMLAANYQGHSQAPIDVKVQTFHRTRLDDPRRGGVITNAAIMTMTSTPNRTQPITRGAWVNSVIFNDPPEPPPADVPPLPEVDSDALAKFTIRERLAVHRQRADCASCHDQIDPLGFALENYGPTGVWRDQYENGRQVDVSGVLFHQYPFESLVEFKQLIVEHKPRFIRAFTAHLLSYALARPLGPADVPAVDRITQRAVSGEDSLRQMLKHVAMSHPFRHFR